MLTATKGSHTKRLEASLSELLGIEHVIACASGSAAVHVAVAGLDPEPGDEIITTSITEDGAIDYSALVVPSPVVYGATKVFVALLPNGTPIAL